MRPVREGDIRKGIMRGGRISLQGHERLSYKGSDHQRE
jgi:hypothetical protein